MRGEEVCSNSYLTSALDGSEWSASLSGRALPPGKGPPVPIVYGAGGWVGLRANLDAGARRKILCSGRESNPNCPARSQTLYYLSYRGSCKYETTVNNRKIMSILLGYKIFRNF
jgi:hypothetical protein